MNVVKSEADSLRELSLKYSRGYIGQDSEFFLWDKEEGKVVPSYLFYPEKEHAIFYYKVSDPYSKVFRDGLAVEVNSRPQLCRAYIINDVQRIIQETRPPELRKLEKVSFTSRPVVELTQELVDHFPPDLQILGCHPTLDAYKQKTRVVQVDPKKLLFRTSGSHLHMGFQKESHYVLGEVPVPFWSRWVKACDLFLGVPFTLLFQDSLEFKRRTLYGQAGEFRHQQYSKTSCGLEYRVLSSRLWNHPAIASLFLNLFKYVVGNFDFTFGRLQWDKAWEDDIQEAINTGNQRALGRAMFLWAENYPGSGDGDQYLLNKGLSPDDVLNFWRKAKRIADLTPDAGVVNQQWREAHYGWNEYLSNEFAEI